MLWEYVRRREMEYQYSQGEAKGKADGLRLAIRSFCEARQLTPSPEQLQWLESAGVEDLEARLASLLREGHWVEE